MSASAARQIAFEVVSRVRERTGYAHEVLDARLKRGNVSAADTALATRLAYGTIQTQGTLDDALGRYTSGKKLEPRVRDAMQVAAYEILYLHTPARAAVNEGVARRRAGSAARSSSRARCAAPPRTTASS